MPPNILFVLTDNQRHDLLGCAGHPVLSTPHLDHLARRGTRFSRAFATSPICSASRASILTGLYERRHQFTFDAPPLHADLAIASYPALLHAAGYRTALIGKLGIESRGVGDAVSIEDAAATVPAMFDHLDNYEHWSKHGYEIPQPNGDSRHLTDITGDKAIAFLESCCEPFCLSISFNAPHAQDNDPRQYVWPEQENGLYADAVFADPDDADPALFDALPPFLRESESRRRWHLRYDAPDKFQRSMRGLCRMISGIDRNLGRILSALGDRADNTIVIFTSDHGMFYGERGLSDCWLLHEEALRVPLLIYDPRAPRDAVVRDELTLNVDLAPTMLQLAGLPIPDDYQGRSLAPLLNGETPPWREDFLCEHHFPHPGIPRSEGIRTRNWKYFRYYQHDHECLYNLRSDPCESINLAKDPAHSHRLSSLRARCDELIRELGP